MNISNNVFLGKYQLDATLFHTALALFLKPIKNKDPIIYIFKQFKIQSKI